MACLVTCLSSDQITSGFSYLSVLLFFGKSQRWTFIDLLNNKREVDIKVTPVDWTFSLQPERPIASHCHHRALLLD